MLRRRRPTRPPRPPRTGAPAPALVGVTPDGARVRVETGPGSRLVAAFLTSSCTGCGVFWAALATAGEGSQPVESAVVVVTPDPATEDRRAVQNLAPPGLPVVMSTEGWLDYGVNGSPWFVVVADGVIRAEGVAHDWSELADLIPTG